MCDNCERVNMAREVDVTEADEDAGGFRSRRGVLSLLESIVVFVGMMRVDDSGVAGRW